MNSPFAVDFAGTAAGLGDVVLAEDPDADEFEFDDELDVPPVLAPFVDVCACELLGAVTLLVAACLVVADFAAAELCVGLDWLDCAALPVVEEEEVDAVDAPAAPPNGLPGDRAISVELSWGGVIARTAPRPPTAPPAIKSARFIYFLFPLLSLVAPRYSQTFSRLP